LLAGALGLAWSSVPDRGPLLAQGGGSVTAAATSSNLVLVELFTSEGCSSCPRADDLLAELAAEAERAGTPIACVSYHVDYWDRLGWKDPFGDAAFTARQRRYAVALGEEGLYTPQLVVDGRLAMVGSDRARVREALTQALARPGRAEVRASVAPAGDGTLGVELALSSAPSTRLVVNAALVERERRSRPTRGENAGHALRHAWVARAAAERALGPGGPGTSSLRLTIPGDLDRTRAAVVVWVADATDLAILGATRVAVPTR
jgi:hypothetical protein